MSEKYAFLFGNSTYQDARLNRLNAPEEDIRAFSDVLEDKEIGGFNVTWGAINGPVAVVQTNLTKFLALRKRDDVVLVYFTGHGLLDNQNRLYLALSETNAEYPSIGSMPADWLRESLDFCASERQILILDCCHSGAYIDGRKGADDQIAINSKTFDRQGYGRYVLAASSKTQSAIEIGGRSEYTRALVDGLRDGIAAHGKPDISVADLQDYLVEHFSTSVAPMRPEGAAIKKIGNLVIARNRYFVPPIDGRLKRKLLDRDADRRISAIHELEEKAGSELHREEILELLRSRISEQNPQRENLVKVDNAIRKAIRRIEPGQPALDYVPRAVGAEVAAKTERAGKKKLLALPAAIAAAVMAIGVYTYPKWYVLTETWSTDVPVSGAFSDFEKSLTLDQVKTIQRYLCVSTVDGTFSAETRANLREFSEINGDILYDEGGERLIAKAIADEPCDRRQYLNIFERMTLSKPGSIQLLVNLLNTAVPTGAPATKDAWRQKLGVATTVFNARSPGFPPDQLTRVLYTELVVAQGTNLRSVEPNDPPWLKHAFVELTGRVREVAGGNPEIDKYVHNGKLTIGTVDDWNVAFVAWCLETSLALDASHFVWDWGDSLTAESFTSFGTIKYDDVVAAPRGALVVFQGSGKSVLVGFYLGIDDQGLVLILSGDSNEAVEIGAYAKDRVISARSF